jgi:hypothetical protein
MGQYYVAIILGEAGERREFIRAWISAHSYACGVKLMEHSYIGNPYMCAVEWLLSPKGHFWKSRLVWAGDYADDEADADEDGSTSNLHSLTDEEPNKAIAPNVNDTMGDYPYLVNHTKRQVVDKRNVQADDRGFRIHPLSLLTAEGNGRGGGDYRGSNEEKVGSWARDVISVEREVPEGYQFVEVDFRE